MNSEKLTQKSIEALNLATSTAKENGNQQVNSLHLLYALTIDEEGVTARILEKMNINAQKVLHKNEKHNYKYLVLFYLVEP